VSDILKRMLAEAAERFGPIPEQVTFGDGIDWSSELAETMLYVELPFWLMLSPGPVDIEWAGTTFTIHVCPMWMEVFVHEVTDSRVTVAHQGPWHPTYEPTQELAVELARHQEPWMRRLCKTVLRLSTRAHSSAFRELGPAELPRVRAEQEAYWASLCEAHIPVVNELIQRYRLVTYDHFAFEVSAWDVSVWYLKHSNKGYRAVLLPYKSWDCKPVIVEDGAAPSDPPKVRPFQWAELPDLGSMTSAEATPGEFDLLDARSLMQRGHYTGAVRRAVTAMEAVVAWALLGELKKNYSASEAEQQLKNTDNDFPGRLRQWRKLANPPISQQEFDEFEVTRKIRHDIVHRGLRLGHNERGLAQRAVDTGRWCESASKIDPL
jgi:hypothetical protein